MTTDRNTPPLKLSRVPNAVQAHKPARGYVQFEPPAGLSDEELYDARFDYTRDEQLPDKRFVRVQYSGCRMTMISGGYERLDLNLPAVAMWELAPDQPVLEESSDVRQ